MRIFIVVSILVLVIIGVVDNLVTSAKIRSEYQKAVAAAQEAGIEAGQQQFEAALGCKSWTTFMTIADIRREWPEAIARIALERCTGEPPLRLTRREGTDARTYLLWLRENHPRWEGHDRLVNTIAKTVFERSQEYAQRPADAIIDQVDINAAAELAEMSNLLAQDKETALDDKKRQSLVATARTVQARIPTDQTNLNRWLEETRLQRQASRSFGF